MPAYPVSKCSLASTLIHLLHISSLLSYSLLSLVNEQKHTAMERQQCGIVPNSGWRANRKWPCIAILLLLLPAACPLFVFICPLFVIYVSSSKCLLIVLLLSPFVFSGVTVSHRLVSVPSSLHRLTACTRYQLRWLVKATVFLSPFGAGEEMGHMRSLLFSCILLLALFSVSLSLSLFRHHNNTPFPFQQCYCLHRHRM